MNQEIRHGRFTSSDIHLLLKKDRSGKGWGAPALTYIEECNIERRLGRSIEREVDAWALAWGKLCERRVFDLLGTDYKLCSDETIVHAEIDCWAGSPDGFHFIKKHGDPVFDIKCPQLKAFCQLVNYWKKGGVAEIRDRHRDGEKYYWQLVSNAILTGRDYAELIVYCPYKSELEAIRELANNWDGEDQYRFFRFVNARDEELPYLPDGGYYKNLNVFRFQVPEDDKLYLTEHVLRAENELIEVPEKLLQ